MSRSRLLVLVVLTMIAFAGNSLLCRLALRNTPIDAASFTSIRIVSGALALWLIVRVRDGGGSLGGNFGSALVLFGYAILFSFAYLSLPAGSGALLLFGAVQATMIGWGLHSGERLLARQWLGVALASAGLVGLVLPGISAPSPLGSALMLGAGVGWGIYSLRGRGGGDPTRTNAGNFIRAVPFALLASVACASQLRLDGRGVIYAVASGALTSGVGYSIWYTALKGLKATQAATIQLSVPVIAALGGVLFLDEHVGVRLVLAAAAILGGIALVILRRQPTLPPVGRPNEVATSKRA